MLYDLVSFSDKNLETSLYVLMGVYQPSFCRVSWAYLVFRMAVT